MIRSRSHFAANQENPQNALLQPRAGASKPGLLASKTPAPARSNGQGPANKARLVQTTKDANRVLPVPGSGQPSLESAVTKGSVLGYYSYTEWQRTSYRTDCSPSLAGQDEGRQSERESPFTFSQPLEVQPVQIHLRKQRRSVEEGSARAIASASRESVRAVQDA